MDCWKTTALVICIFARFLNAAVPEERVYNGLISKAGQFPYQALLSTRTGNLVSYCGGSLIKPSWVLTAAHCLFEDAEPNVSLGILDSSSTSTGVSITASQIYIYEGYSETNILGDIALVKLSTPAPLGKYIRTINLPASSYRDPSKYDHKKVCVSGWGDTSNNQVRLTREMRHSLLRVMGHFSCSETLGYHLTSGRLCTDKYYKNSGPCEGDSGGPLADCAGTCSCGRSATLVGIVSYRTADSCKNGYPEVYTNVAYYLDWIKSKITN